MFVTNAERRRWLAFQWDRYPAHIPGSRWNLKTIKKENIWELYSDYIMNTNENPKTLEEWFDSQKRK